MTVVALPPEQLDALADKVAERILRAQSAPVASPVASPVVHLGPMTCEQFGAAIGRSAEYVQDHCRTGGLRALPGKPYRILPEELARYRAEGLLTGAAKKRRAA